MPLVVDTRGANLKAFRSSRPSNVFEMSKVISVIPSTSGVEVSAVEYFFEKDCPLDVEVLRVWAVMRKITPEDFTV